jgi:hypothetical protein
VRIKKKKKVNKETERTKRARTREQSDKGKTVVIERSGVLCAELRGAVGERIVCEPLAADKPIARWNG